MLGCLVRIALTISVFCVVLSEYHDLRTLIASYGFEPYYAFPVSIILLIVMLAIAWKVPL